MQLKTNFTVGVAGLTITVSKVIFWSLGKRKCSWKLKPSKMEAGHQKLGKSFYNVQISGFTLCAWQKLWLIYLIINFIRQTTMPCLPNWQITYFAVTIIILGLFLYWKINSRAYFWLLWHVDRFLMKKCENRISQYSFPDWL